MKYILHIFIALCIVDNMRAQYDFKEAGICYNKKSSTEIEVVESIDNSYSGDIEIPSEIIYKDTKYTVTSVSNSAFAGCTNLKTIILPSSLEKIGLTAFANCINLIKVTVHNSIKSIGSLSFAGCAKLNDVVIIIDDFEKNNLCASIAKNNHYFFNKKEIKGSFTIPNLVTRIGTNALAGCVDLNSISIPNTVTTIGNGAFSGCTNLETINKWHSVVKIEELAFSGCSGLKDIEFPTSLESIGHSAFQFCEGLTKVTVNNSVNNIGNNAFNGCTSLKDVFINITSISNDNRCFCIPGNKHYLFRGKEIMGTFILPDSTKIIGDNALCDCLGLTKLYIPNSVTKINECAFKGCKNMNKTFLGAELVSIGSEAFSGCTELKSVTIPSKVTSIGSLAFEDCNKLKIIDYCVSKPTSIVDNVFTAQVYENAILNVTLTGYYYITHNCDGWNNFKNINWRDFTIKYDVNGDKAINTADVVGVYNYIIQGPESGLSSTTADVNCDNEENTADVVDIYNYIINGE